METRHTVLVVGAGLAGAKAAEAARSSGHEGRIVLVGDEPEPPYERPPLSKGVLRGESDPASARVHAVDFYDQHDIELRTGTAVRRLALDQRVARLSDGDELPFGAVVLATGAEPRALTVPGAALDGVHYLRTLADAVALRASVPRAARVAVVGAGWIGSEVAASARMMGKDVVLIEPGPVPLQRVLGTEVGGVFRQLHADHDVSLRFGVGVSELQGSTAVENVVLSDGRVEPADVVVVGVGVEPRVDLARAAGLRVDNGVVVDEYLRASAPHVYAAGDVASVWNPRFQRHLRVEHWANALNQGATAGGNAVGPGAPYERLPYFYSDQYDLGLEYVGFADATSDVTIRGSLRAREFIAYYHRNGVVDAALAVNVGDVVEELKQLVANGRPIEVASLGSSRDRAVSSA